jgi:hypothetical protein
VNDNAVVDELVPAIHVPKLHGVDNVVLLSDNLSRGTKTRSLWVDDTQDNAHLLPGRLDALSQKMPHYRDDAKLVPLRLDFN